MVPSSNIEYYIIHLAQVYEHKALYELALLYERCSVQTRGDNVSVHHTTENKLAYCLFVCAPGGVIGPPRIEGFLIST